MTERSYLVRLPWPPTKTSSNGSQGDYFGKARAASDYKSTCAWECKAQGISTSAASKATARITYHPPRNGRVDWDNISNRCKQGFDAIAEAVGIDDGDWWPVVLDRGEKVKGGCVLVEIVPHVEVPIVGVVADGKVLRNDA